MYIDEPYGSSTQTVIDMQDIVGDLQFKWMLGVLLCSIYLFIYVLFNLFVQIKPESEHFWLVQAMHEWAVIPSCLLIILAFTYFTGFSGI